MSKSTEATIGQATSHAEEILGAAFGTETASEFTGADPEKVEANLREIASRLAMQQINADGLKTSTLFAVNALMLKEGM